MVGISLMQQLIRFTKVLRTYCRVFRERSKTSDYFVLILTCCSNPMFVLERSSAYSNFDLELPIATDHFNRNISPYTEILL